MHFVYFFIYVYIYMYIYIIYTYIHMHILFTEYIMYFNSKYKPYTLQVYDFEL